tara:strand:+ start:1 stop:798 length:798 start_codon:yes stop_codon:yes gene_type:complete
MGPRGIREASTLFSFGHNGAYDFEDDITYLPADKTKIVDIGDADIIHTDTKKSHQNIKYGVKKILEANSIPVILGGDHSINIPCIDAFENQEPIHLIQIDAHLDFVNERHGVKYGHGNPMMRASEKSYVSGITQIGIRNVSSTAKEGYIEAKKRGSKIFSVRDMRSQGIKTILKEIPKNKRYYLTIDIDAFDPSIASGTGTPSHGGFYYYEILEFVDALIKQGRIEGLDLVEVAPDYDLTNSTSTLAAQLLMNIIGRIIYHKNAK